VVVPTSSGGGGGGGGGDGGGDGSDSNPFDEIEAEDEFQDASAFHDMGAVLSSSESPLPDTAATEEPNAGLDGDGLGGLGGGDGGGDDDDGTSRCDVCGENGFSKPSQRFCGECGAPRGASVVLSKETAEPAAMPTPTSARPSSGGAAAAAAAAEEEAIPASDAAVASSTPGSDTAPAKCEEPAAPTTAQQATESHLQRSSTAPEDASMASSTSSTLSAFDLPYGGDIQQAMRNQDRAAIRAIQAYQKQERKAKAAEEAGRVEMKVAPALWSRFLDPLTGDLMADPVSLEDGRTYDRPSIEREFERQRAQMEQPAAQCGENDEPAGEGNGGSRAAAAENNGNDHNDGTSCGAAATARVQLTCPVSNRPTEGMMMPNRLIFDMIEDAVHRNATRATPEEIEDWHKRVREKEGYRFESL
jgi:hypothetical protein